MQCETVKIDGAIDLFNIPLNKWLGANRKVHTFVSKFIDNGASYVVSSYHVKVGLSSQKQYIVTNERLLPIKNRLYLNERV